MAVQSTRAAPLRSERLGPVASDTSARHLELRAEPSGPPNPETHDEVPRVLAGVPQVSALVHPAHGTIQEPSVE